MKQHHSYQLKSGCAWTNADIGFKCILVEKDKSAVVLERNKAAEKKQKTMGCGQNRLIQTFVNKEFVGTSS